MATPLAVQTTAQGILIPRAAFQDWGEIEVLQEKDRIVIQPKPPAPVQEREAITQALREAGLLDEPKVAPDLPLISDEKRAELAKKLSVGRPLSEIIIEDREDRV